MPHYLTYDLGTTALKTALIRDDGQLVASSSYEYTLLHPAPGQAEMPPEVYWQAVLQTTRQVLAETGAAVRAIGFSSQGQTFVPIDRRGNPLYNAISWLDARAASIAEQWTSTWLPPEGFFTASGYSWVPPGLTIFQIAWLQQNRPAAHQAWKFLFLPDYLIYRLTGSTVTDPVIARMGGMFDLTTGTWDPALLQAAGITPQQLPKILPCGSVGGHLSRAAAAELGLPPGIPVCTGANDQITGAVGAGNVRPGIISETTGTALAVVATTPTLMPGPRLTVGGHALPGLYYAMSYANTSAVLLTWLRDLCGQSAESFDRFLAGAANIPPGSDGLTVLPYFSGDAPGSPFARGAFLGLTLSHTRDHLIRAIMEACACLLREHLEPLAQQIPIASVRSLGRSSRSDLWLQIKADLLNLPIERPACSAAASLGAAMLAAAGTGQFASIANAADAWYRPEAVFTPQPAGQAVYSEVYARYQQYSQRVYRA